MKIIYYEMLNRLEELTKMGKKCNKLCNILLNIVIVNGRDNYSKYRSIKWISET